MKIILLIFSLFAFICNFFLFPQKTIKLELEIEDCYDDHSKRIFRYSVQKWGLENDKLMYNTTGTDYSDTLFLSKLQIERIIEIVDNQEFSKNINLSYNPPPKTKVTHTKRVKGELHINSQTYFYDLRENVYTILENQDYKNIRVLESYLDSLAKKE